MMWKKEEKRFSEKLGIKRQDSGRTGAFGLKCKKWQKSINGVAEKHQQSDLTYKSDSSSCVTSHFDGDETQSSRVSLLKKW